MPGKKVTQQDAKAIYEQVFGKRVAEETPDWGAADPVILHRLISAVVACGGLVSFSKAQKGFAYVLTIMHDSVNQDDRKHYINSAVELNEILMWHVDKWEAYREAMMDAGLL